MAAPPPSPKKTGNQLSPGCGCLFFSIFFFAGLAVLVFMLSQFREGWRIHHEYVQGTCTILDKRLVSSSDSDGTTYRPEFDFEVLVYEGAEAGGNSKRYKATGYDGVNVMSSGQESKEATLAQYVVGSTYPCWYDPQNPSKAVLAMPSPWYALFLLFPLPFLAVGLGGIIWSLKQRSSAKLSPEAQIASKTRTVFSAEGVLPEVKTEPGSTLPHRLVLDQSEKAAAIALGIFGLIWTGVTGAIWLGMWSRGEWFPFIFLSIFVLVGLAILAAAVWQALIGWGTGRTVVEVSTFEPAPGGHFEVLVAQYGHMTVNELSVWLICEEKATYRQGTNTRTDTHRVYEKKLDARTGFAITGAGKEELRTKAEIPADAMHSFKAGHNAIRWFLEVRADIERWPDFKRGFPFRVPAQSNRS
ncbi:MAG: DUF3592 domain-containing protein [Planctomycetes bacterium]|nr:DUF3592 domain-containing protein [Planctomycetota bacterium]